MLAASVYLLVPTADEALIHPTIAVFFLGTFNVPIIYGVFISIIIYRAAGAGCLAAALVTGGKPIYDKIKGAKKRLR